MEKLKKAYKKASVISFDVFDTLIRRNVAKPSDLFRVMEAQGNPVPPGFARQRLAAERAAVIRWKRPVSLPEIYDELKEVYGDGAEELMRLEIRAELNGCCPDPKYVSMFNECVKAGKRVVLISDMYLSGEEIGAMLERCGVTGYEKLFVSCEAGATKSEGSIFDTVLSEFNISPRELLHIGDDRRRDMLIPFLKGVRISPVFCRKNTGSKKHEADLARRTLDTCIERIKPELNEYERLGCRTFGPLLVGFGQWLLDRLRADGIRDVYFMSRDGYMIKQAFDMLAPGEIHTHYLYCSRRSYTVPLIWKHSDFDELMGNITISPQGKALRKFLLSVGLVPEEYEEPAARYGLGIDDIYEFDSFLKSEAVRSFYNEIRPVVEKVSHQEFEAFSKYILQNFQFQERIAVVDIGYHGTMQNALEQLLREMGFHVRVKGYYLGTAIDKAPLITKGLIEAEGYLYEPGKNETLFDAFGKFIAIYESIFLAQHGSVYRFVLKNGQAEPEFCPYEYDIETEKVVDEETVISAYQQGALSLVRHMYEAFSHRLFSIPANIAAQNLVRMGTRPTLWEARLWGDFRVFDQVLMNVAKPSPWTKYMCHPKLLRKDFMQSAWKIGFLRRIFLLPLPYQYIYILLKKYYYKQLA